MLASGWKRKTMHRLAVLPRTECHSTLSAGSANCPNTAADTSWPRRWWSRARNATPCDVWTAPAGAPALPALHTPLQFRHWAIHKATGWKERRDNVDGGPRGAHELRQEQRYIHVTTFYAFRVSGTKPSIKMESSARQKKAPHPSGGQQTHAHRQANQQHNILERRRVQAAAQPLARDNPHQHQR